MSTKKILVVDDDLDILDLVTFNLERAGFETLATGKGVEALQLLKREAPDLVVLDIMLPGMDGIEILKRAKSDPGVRPTPFIMLTAKSEEVDRILGLELGADDYLSKPFSVRELILRIRRTLERASAPEDTTQLRCDGILLDRERYEVRVEGDPVRLTNIEFNLLAYLLGNQGRVLTRDRLLEHVWGYRYTGTTRTVDTHVQRLRDKLGEAGGLIETVRGVGYRIESDV